MPARGGTERDGVGNPRPVSYREDLQRGRWERYRTKNQCDPKVLGTTVSTVKTWEQKGWIPEPRRDPQSGFRVFASEDVEELRCICEERKGMKRSRLGAPVNRSALG